MARERKQALLQVLFNQGSVLGMPGQHQPTEVHAVDKKLLNRALTHSTSMPFPHKVNTKEAGKPFLWWFLAERVKEAYLLPQDNCLTPELAFKHNSLATVNIFSIVKNFKVSFHCQKTWLLCYASHRAGWHWQTARLAKVATETSRKPWLSVQLETFSALHLQVAPMPRPPTAAPVLWRDFWTLRGEKSSKMNNKPSIPRVLSSTLRRRL